MLIISGVFKDFRHVLIISENYRNEFDETVVVLPLISSISQSEIEQNQREVLVRFSPENGLARNSWIICDRPYKIQKDLRLQEPLEVLESSLMSKVWTVWKLAFQDALAVQLLNS